MHLLRHKHQELFDYIKSELSNGVPEGKIRSNLESAGWPNSVVESVFHRIGPHKPETHDPAVLKLTSITKSFGKNTILDSVSLSITKGEIFGIIGLSGSGKTTLLNTIIGFHRPDAGDIMYKHPDSVQYSSVYKNRKEVTKIFGFAPQDPSFYSRLTCEENLDHFGSLYGIPHKARKQHVDSLLNLVELSSARKTLGRNLSGGMQRRLGIACSLIHDPRVLILDEPTADLDPIMRKDVWNLIKNINKKGTTVLLTSHFLSEMEGLCDRIAILHKKSIVTYGTPDELKNRFSKDHEIRMELTTADYSSIIKEVEHKEKSVKKVVQEGSTLIIYTPESEKVLHSLLHIIEQHDQRLLGIEVNKPSLREVFESFVR